MKHLILLLSFVAVQAFGQTQPFSGPFGAVKQGVLMTNGNMASAELDSLAVDGLSYVQFSVQAVFTGSPVGTLKLQTCDDNVSDPTTIPSSHWVDYTGSSSAVSAAGNFSWHLTDGGYRWVRMVYIKTSGTGSLSAEFTRKGYGQ